MLTIHIPARDLWDERKQEFVPVKGCTLKLEHSLLSISKWESKFHKPFLGKENLTIEETLEYIKCMTIDQNIDPHAYLCITDSNLEEIINYINDPMTATWFAEKKSKPSREVVTSEVIYSWMIFAGIPLECQKWHVNRLLTLIRVVNEKSKPPKKMGKKEAIAQQRALNEQRRKQLGTKG